jgi:transposase
MLTRDEILAVCRRGLEAVVALIEELLAQRAAHEKQIAALSARITELEHQLHKDSHNSHKPPSSDGLAKKIRSLRQRTGKKPGGQPGHPGATLRLVEAPDEVIRHSPAACTVCGTCLADTPEIGFERRQMHEIPPLTRVVTEHRALRKVCPVCQTVTSGAFPPEVSQAVQYGDRLKATAVYLQDYQLLPFARTCELLEDLCGVALSEGTLASAQAACYVALAPVEAAIKDALTAAHLAQFDETGLRIEAKTHWLHVAGTPTLTFYAHHPRRGPLALEAIGILPGFRGTALHDCWSAYFAYPCAHALCNAHLLRELIAIHEQTEQPWAGQMIELLLKIKTAVAAARAAGAPHLEPVVREAFEARFQELLSAGWQANPPAPRTGRRGPIKQSPARNLLGRLDKYHRAVLAFMDDFAVPFDNNLAERDLRMVKVRQKISGCFRSPAGASYFCRIRGYISTLRKQGDHVLTALQSVFSGKLYMPRLLA